MSVFYVSLIACLLMCVFFVWYYREKIRTIVHFPIEGLDLSPWVSTRIVICNASMSVSALHLTFIRVSICIYSLYVDGFQCYSASWSLRFVCGIGECRLAQLADRHVPFHCPNLMRSFLFVVPCVLLRITTAG